MNTATGSAARLEQHALPEKIAARIAALFEDRARVDLLINNTLQTYGDAGLLPEPKEGWSPWRLAEDHKMLVREKLQEVPES